MYRLDFHEEAEVELMNPISGMAYNKRVWKKDLG